MSTDLVTIACAALAKTKHKLVTAAAHVPNATGFYSVYGASDTWRQFGLGDLSIGFPEPGDIGHVSGEGLPASITRKSLRSGSRGRRPPRHGSIG